MDRTACQSTLQEGLNFAGIFHALPSGKRDTGGGEKAPVAQVLRAASSMASAEVGPRLKPEGTKPRIAR